MHKHSSDFWVYLRVHSLLVVPLQREAARRHPNQIPKPPQLAPFRWDGAATLLLFGWPGFSLHFWAQPPYRGKLISQIVSAILFLLVTTHSSGEVWSGKLKALPSISAHSSLQASSLSTSHSTFLSLLNKTPRYLSSFARGLWWLPALFTAELVRTVWS